MSQCPHCQQDIGTGASETCPLCGASLSAGGPASASPPPPPPPPPPPTSSASPDPGGSYYQGGSGQAQSAASQDITREEWQAFLGNNAEVYLGKFARFAQGGEQFQATWHWPAFLATFWWFLYRKLYLWFGLCLVGVFVPYIKFAVWIGAAIAANYIYYIEAQKQIRAIKATCPPDQLLARLAQAGGVHVWVPWVAVLVSLGLFLLMAVIMLFVGGLTMGWFMGMSAGH